MQREKLLIVGAGIAGLYTAAALQHYYEMTIVEMGNNKFQPTSSLIKYQNKTKSIGPTSATGVGGGINIWGARWAEYLQCDATNAVEQFRIQTLRNCYMNVYEKFSIRNEKVRHEKLVNSTIDQHVIKDVSKSIHEIAKSMLNSENLKLNKKVTQIEFPDKSCCNVFFSDGTTAVYNKVILCTGALEVIAILKRSGIISAPIKIGTHPKMNIGSATLSKKGVNLLKSKKTRSGSYVFGLRLDNLKTKFGINSYIQLVPLSSNVIFDSMPAHPVIKQFINLALKRSFITKFLAQVYIKLSTNNYYKNKKYRVRLFIDQTESTALEFDGTRFNIENASLSREKLDYIHNQVSEIFSANRIGDYKPASKSEIQKTSTYVHSHFTGGLIQFFNEDCELKSNKNLLSINSCLLPYCGYANPTLSLLALSEIVTKKLIVKS